MSPNRLVVFSIIGLFAAVPWLRSASTLPNNDPAVGTVFDLGRTVTMSATIERYSVTRGAIDDFGASGTMKWHATEWKPDRFAVCPADLRRLVMSAPVLSGFVVETRPSLSVPIANDGSFDVMAAPDDASATVAYGTSHEPTGSRSYFPMGPIGEAPVPCGDLRVDIPDTNDRVQLSLAESAGADSTIVAIVGADGSFKIVAGCKD